MTAVFLAVLLSLSAEPEFAGRPLSAWTKQLKEDDTPRRRRAAALALGQIGANNPETLSVVLAALGKAARADGSPEVRRQAVTAVAQQKPDDSVAAVEDFTEALRAEKDGSVRLELATALGRFGPAAAPAVKPLSACLPDADPKLRVAAVVALGRIGVEASSAAPDLLARLSDADPAVAREAAAAVSRVKPADPAAAAAALVTLLNKADGPLRREVLESLGRLEDRGAPTVAAVAAELAHTDTDVRLAAAQTLARFGPAALMSHGRLTDALRQDASPKVREAVARAVVSVCRAEPATAVRTLADRVTADPSVEVRVTIAELLGGYAAVAAAALPELRRARTDPDPRVRQAATEAVRRVETKK
jgi:HEAT repeat protein